MFFFELVVPFFVNFSLNSALPHVAFFLKTDVIKFEFPHGWNRYCRLLPSVHLFFGHKHVSVVLWLCLPDIVEFRFIESYRIEIVMILTFQQWLFLCRLFSFYPGRVDLINPQLAESLGVQALTDRNDQSFSLGSYELSLDKFNDSAHVLRTFIAGQLHDDLDILFICLVLDSDLLIEYEFIWWRRSNLSGELFASVLEIKLARKLYLELNVKNIQCVRVDLRLILGHIKIKIYFKIIYLKS